MERIGAFYQRIRKEGHAMQWEATLRVCTELRNRHGGRNPHSAIIAKYIGMKERKNAETATYSEQD